MHLLKPSSQILSLALGVLLCSSVNAVSGDVAMNKARNLHEANRERLRQVMSTHFALGDDDELHTAAGGRVVRKRKDRSPVTFANKAAEQFHVDGTKIPDVDFDAGDSWAGLMPISGDPEETRKLFFWFWPTSNPSNSDKFIFWTNGPGCSSMEGLLQENGPISWSWGQAKPTKNSFAWTRLANVVWVEQPVGTGFSQGKPNITNDDELAAQATGFLGQFLEVFSELKGSDFYLTGESYAGYYVPYIANWIYEHPGTVDLNLKGIWISDASLSLDVVQQQIPALRFAQANKNVFPFDNATYAKLQNISDTCGYTDYLEKNLKYPPAGQLPFPEGTPGGHVPSTCDIFTSINFEISNLNPSFNIYRVTETFPTPWSVLGFPEAVQSPLYFNRTDVQDAIHAPHIDWQICNAGSGVYVDKNGNPGSDQSLPSTLSVLPNVIEKSERTVIVHGLADMILIAEGTRIAIQNMTWGGSQGFQTPIGEDNFIVDNMGPYGNMHQEKNLTYVEFSFSGHMTPQFVPWAAFQTLSYLVGETDSPSA